MNLRRMKYKPLPKPSLEEILQKPLLNIVIELKLDHSLEADRVLPIDIFPNLTINNAKAIVDNEDCDALTGGGCNSRIRCEDCVLNDENSFPFNILKDYIKNAILCT